MKSLLFAALLLAGFVSVARAQQQADDKYIGIYGLIQQADHLAETGDPGEALAAYTDAQASLERFQKVYPNWNPNIISFRLNQVTGKIADLKGRVPAPAAAVPKVEKPAGTSATPAPATPAPVEAPTNAQPAPELENLRAQLQAEQTANENLQAKLKEALSVQPAAVDPRELAKAQEKIRWLMKENDLLKASHVTAEPSAAVTRYITNTVTVVVTNSQPVVVTNFAAAFAKSTAPVVVTNFIRVLVPDTNALEMARLDRAAAVRNFNDEHIRAEQLADELQKLRNSAGSAAVGTNDNSALAALRAENAALRSELAALRSGTPAAGAGGDLAIELKQARARIAALQSEAEIAALEKKALESRLQQLVAATNSSASAMAYESRIRELTQERNDLIERLDTANKQKGGGKNSELVGQLASLNSEVSLLRSRLAVAEAQPVPFTAEELALFQSATPKPAGPDAGKKSIQEMPAGTAELVASAQGHFARQEFDQAEADYQKILERDQNNGLALANIAMIELQQGKLTEADKHIAAALAQSPNDPYNLSTLGYLKLRQEKYDDALNALSRAAQLDSNNPEIQNYLGLALSHLGQRKQAETALRKAIQINPNYAPAHNNLAVLYLSQTPPLAELARWHYQKALDAGQPRNPDLEKMLADKGAPVAP